MYILATGITAFFFALLAIKLFTPVAIEIRLQAFKLNNYIL
ncbi:hypothetical protein BPTFM16_02894 [Altererythrobacter insulae]|nr:hypothetical protein BPTFM16_02894 [Altererythrobacter insulae]